MRSTKSELKRKLRTDKLEKTWEITLSLSLSLSLPLSLSLSLPPPSGYDGLINLCLFIKCIQEEGHSTL